MISRECTTKQLRVSLNGKLPRPLFSSKPEFRAELRIAAESS